MTPRRLLGLSAVLVWSVFAVLLVTQGGALPAAQFQGLLFASLLALALSVLVFRARSFASAARAYIAVLGVALLGCIAAAVAHARVGDVLGLLSSVTGCLFCAAHLVSELRAPKADDAEISVRSVANFRRFVSRISDDLMETQAALAEATELSAPYLEERFAQLRSELAYAESWGQRLGVAARPDLSCALSKLRRQLR